MVCACGKQLTLRFALCTMLMGATAAAAAGDGGGDGDGGVI